MIKHYQQVKRLEDDLLEPFSNQPGRSFSTLAIAINSDSLATWFLKAVIPVLKMKHILLDLRCEDQDQTLQLLKNGDVIGCVSAHNRPVQGCRTDYLGRMDYSMVATPAFAAQWFAEGFIEENIENAPLLVFNRTDTLHQLFFQQALKRPPSDPPIHYLPSSDRFVDFIIEGLAYGMLPNLQSKAHLLTGKLVKLRADCPVTVHLFWHCWNIQSRLLDEFSRRLVGAAQKMLVH